HTYLDDLVVLPVGWNILRGRPHAHRQPRRHDPSDPATVGPVCDWPSSAHRRGRDARMPVKVFTRFVLCTAEDTERAENQGGEAIRLFLLSPLRPPSALR